ncbi:MAG: 23S rRNA (guanosine(2251)-2'-O)-methyltransferase RlmB [Firmicutes bacterium]|nr:23S rRNA (guanosine(2251)-2'-O)-methyltransferase RlmB [Bacillota bacterium]
MEGRQPVLELLRTGKTINRLMVAKGEHHGSIKQIIALAKERNIVLQLVERQYLNKLSETGAHQGVIAQISPIEYLELDDVLEANQGNKNAFYLVLDGISDPHNLGSLIRTAETSGVTAVIIPKHRAAGVTATVIKTSAGAAFHLPICRVTNLAMTIKTLKENGCWIVGADMDGTTMYQQDLTGPIALVVGSEGKGMSELVKKSCDFIVSIPMFGKINSLNASVAGGLIMYEIVRQRKFSQ